MYLDLCSDGLVVKGIAVEQGGDPCVQFGSDAPIPVPSYVRNLRAVRTPDGRHIAAWKGQDGIGCLVDRAVRVVMTLGTVYGDEAIALTGSGTPAYVTSQTEYVFGHRRPIPPHRVGTSQGLASVADDGTVVWGDDQLYGGLTRGPFRFVQYQEIGGWVIGKTDKGAIAWHEPTSTPYVITDVNTPWAIRGQIVQGRLICVTSLPGLVIAEDDFRRWTPAAEPIPAIGRPCWLGWFEFRGPSDTPSTSAIPVTQGQPWLPVTGQGVTLARYVAADEDSDQAQLAAAIARAKADGSGLPVMAYWTLQGQQAGPVPDAGTVAVPDADIVAVEAYRKKHESIELFTRRVDQALWRVARAGKFAALICQGYTSNTTNTADLAASVPVYAALARTHRHVVGLYVFSAGPGRATGWNDHPEIHAVWRELAAGIAGIPAVEPPKPPKPPKPEEPAGVFPRARTLTYA